MLLALPAEPYDACETAGGAQAKSLVTIRQNRDSVPVALAGLKVSARVGAREITINHGGREVARHVRLHGKGGSSAQLDHHLELLARKPAVSNTPSRSARSATRGKWPDCFDELWTALSGRYGRSDAARQMVDVVLLCRDHGPERVALAVRGALTAGAIDGRAVAGLARRAQTPAVEAAPLTGLDTRLAAHDRPAPDGLGDHNRLHDLEAGAMSWAHYCELEACSETETDWTGDHVVRRLVIATMTDEGCRLPTAVCALTIGQAREVALELLSIAEHADKHTNGSER